jgi:SAM-dependent methyltransferase
MRAVDDLLRATAQAEASHFWFRGFRWFVAPLVRRALDVPWPPRILDCGCGTGANLDLLGQFGTVYGFDISATGLYFGRRGGRQRLVRATVAAVPFRSDTFDLVTSFDVLYSLEGKDEDLAMAEMFRLARPGGRVLVNVAAMNVLRGDHSVLGREVRRYTRRTLAALVTGAGFTIERMTYTNAVLFVPLLVARTFERWRGLAAGATRDISTPPAPLNAFLSAALLLESVWLRWVNSPFGSSLLCLAKKPEASSRAAARRPYP